jgi:DNA polymerase
MKAVPTVTVAEAIPRSQPISRPEAVPPRPASRTAIEIQKHVSIGVWNTKPLTILERESEFNALNSQVMACRKCDEIVCRRQRTVFGVGSLNAKVVMFGEAPGADEDRVGEPFVGAAGQLLDKILVASGLKRQEVYIINALKCRPPNNRTPTDVEIENCRPFFEAQLEAIQPQYIVCWGAVAVRSVLGSTDSVGRLRGKFHAFRGAKVMVTYHPSYLLRTPDAKKLTWEDMKMLMKDMGIPIPGKS